LQTGQSTRKALLLNIAFRFIADVYERGSDICSLVTGRRTGFATGRGADQDLLDTLFRFFLRLAKAILDPA
jgi:hypothetical protein